jgi:hypothetical protein
MSGDKVDAALRLAAAITAKRAELGAMEAEFRGLFAEPPPAAARRDPRIETPEARSGRKAAPAPEAKTCGEPGCESPKHAKGLCNKHYLRKYVNPKKKKGPYVSRPRKNGKDAAGRLYPKTRKPPRKPGEPVPECSSPEGCLRPAFSKGLCAKHYHASWRAAKGRPSRAKPRAGLNGVSLLAGGGGGAASEEE